MSNKMPEQNSAYEIEELALHRTLDSLQEKYQEGAVEVPDLAIDRQILAAAHREIKAPNKKIPLKNSLWRKFSLPLYATATFAFTALAIHVLLPTPARVPPGTSAGPVSIDVINTVNANGQLINENSTKFDYESRKKLFVPEVEQLQSLPKLPKTELTLTNDSAENSASQLKKNAPVEFTIQLEGSINGLNDLSNVNLIDNTASQQTVPNKDLWAREIINLFKSGEHQKAHNELKRFKKIFPDFPIDEQVEALKQ